MVARHNAIAQFVSTLSRLVTAHTDTLIDTTLIDIDKVSDTVSVPVNLEWALSIVSACIPVVY